jgi:hypothetical protein
MCLPIVILLLLYFFDLPAASSSNSLPSTMSFAAHSISSRISQNHQMNPSVQPFRSKKSFIHQSPAQILKQRPPPPTALLQPTFVSVLIQPPTCFNADVIEPSRPSERLNMHQQAPINTQWPYPQTPRVDGPSTTDHIPETLIADMWRTCPALCASIRQNFDLGAIFHPALFALHGETFLRLAASQIAMHNQAAEMSHMRNGLTRRGYLRSIPRPQRTCTSSWSPTKVS